MPERGPGTAVVTGAAGGIGSAVAARLRADGYHVVGLDLAGADVDCDVTSEPAVAAALAGLDPAVLVTCAGVTAGAPAHETTLADWHAVLNTNLTAAFLCAKHALPAMMTAGRGVIVTVGSVHGRAFAPGLPAYAAAKAGLSAFTRQLAVDYGRHGIRSVCLALGWIRTPDTLTRVADPADLARLTETQSLGEPEHVAAAVAYAVSPAAALLTGAELVLDGGATAVQTAALLRPGPRARLGLPPLREEPA
ncbi:SDR family NAD(P)-dependent oxidoreductase [Dactylosporangium matsuzakiense]|uniref:3-oxoacyl-ACP reductase n=1 Tax=Dactylosporangium matsuzakiense TaxID=53360 RepID=A0A9W6KSA6_9ACTN|nr:SDR family oxidoreductase [Dactylosporangium matsuzakiense]UWZ48353.1 SDR family oxidoreductase [Dactylosporangium matsuzakiense]GLL05495.1 3-oxoacyl-ACP reductase [Dactylosporangium matsuzakiense]